MRPRIRAFLIHLLLSAAIVGGLALVTYYIWYPAPLLALEGGSVIVLIVLGVDIALGPSLTLLVFDTTKKRLWLDMLVVIGVQLAALTYGVFVIYSQRPAYLVFAYSQFYVVRQGDLIGAPPSGLTPSDRFGANGPAVVSSTIPVRGELDGTALLAASIGDPYFALLAENYTDLPSAREALKRETLRSGDLRDVLGGEWDGLARRVDRPLEQLFYFHIRGRERNGIVVVDPGNMAVLDVLDCDALRRERGKS